MFITFIQLARHCTEYRVPMQVSTSDHCETVRQPKVRTIKSVSLQCWWLRKLEFCRHLRPCVRKILGCWCCRVMIHFGWGSGLRQEWAQHSAVPGFHNRSMTLSRVSDRCEASRGISATSGWMEVAGLKLLGVAAAIRRFGRCRTAKSKQHLRHKQRMKIHPEWNQRSLSHGAI